MIEKFVVVGCLVITLLLGYAMGYTIGCRNIEYSEKADGKTLWCYPDSAGHENCVAPNGKKFKVVRK